jgi:hypothetical protein
VYPVYPMCYNTFLTYLRRGLKGFGEEPQDNTPSLFDNL